MIPALKNHLDYQSPDSTPRKSRDWTFWGNFLIIGAVILLLWALAAYLFFQSAGPAMP